MIKIIADTTSVIDLDEATRLGITLVPQLIVFGEKSYRDEYEISTEEFLSKLKSSSTLPKTAAPSPAFYAEAYAKIAQAKDTAIVICPSTQISGTYRSATVAAQDYPDADIRIVDTFTIGPALGTLVIKAKEWADAGADAQTIIDRLNAAKVFNKIYFYVDTLEYLHKGGRIGAAQALLGSILQVKPILAFINDKVSFFSQRTKRLALDRLVELVKEDCPHNIHAHFALFQADAMADALLLKEKFESLLGLDSIQISKIPPAMIVHVGPGVVAVSYFTEFPGEL